MKRLEGKIAVVTGGNSGIGLATAKRFADEGATVYITGRRQDKLDEAAKGIGGSVIAVQGDVAVQADLDRLFETVKAKSGRVDVLFANAGVAEFLPMGRITPEHFNRIYDANVKGTLFTVQTLLPLLPKGASVILTGSIVGSKGLGVNSVYASTKAAIRSFARTWTTDLKEQGIRVNVVSPGPIETPGLNDLLGDGEAGKARRAGFSTSVPMGRMGDPDEVAKAVVFLASEESSYVTGAELFVDGGMAQV